MELTLEERMNLIKILPPQGDIMTLKIVRKLRETVSFSEEELGSMNVRYEFKCLTEGCNNTVILPVTTECPDHNTLMAATGQMNFVIPSELQDKTKEIHMGPQALIIVTDALKRADEAKQLTDAHISLYEKFLPPVPESIQKSMEE